LGTLEDEFFSILAKNPRLKSFIGNSWSKDTNAVCVAVLWCLWKFRCFMFLLGGSVVGYQEAVARKWKDAEKVDGSVKSGELMVELAGRKDWGIGKEGFGISTDPIEQREYHDSTIRVGVHQIPMQQLWAGERCDSWLIKRESF